MTLLYILWGYILFFVNVCTGTLKIQLPNGLKQLPSQNANCTVIHKKDNKGSSLVSRARRSSSTERLSSNYCRNSMDTAGMLAPPM